MHVYIIVSLIWPKICAHSISNVTCTELTGQSESIGRKMRINLSSVIIIVYIMSALLSKL